MEPKEKAEEILCKFYKFTWNGEDNLDKRNAKQCALIAVDEIIKSHPTEAGFYQKENREYRFLNYSYWFKVKIEIEKL